ncbi:hypothetical protein ACN6K3_003737, partial [Streptomyces sp. SAS_260]
TITTLLKHTLPTITHPATLTTLNLTPNITHLTQNTTGENDNSNEETETQTETETTPTQEKEKTATH